MDLTPKDGVENSLANELQQAIWSVISFDRYETGGLTYDEAMHRMEELEEKYVSGLCIVTDDAAGRASA